MGLRFMKVFVQPIQPSALTALSLPQSLSFFNSQFPVIHVDLMEPNQHSLLSLSTIYDLTYMAVGQKPSIYNRLRLNQNTAPTPQIP